MHSVLRNVCLFLQSKVNSIFQEVFHYNNPGEGRGEGRGGVVRGGEWKGKGTQGAREPLGMLPVYNRFNFAD